MARRQKSSPLEDLIILASKLPWKVSAASGLVSFIILHTMASRPALKITPTGQANAAIVHSLFTTLAMFGQFLLPSALGIGAIVSAIGAAKNRKLYEGVQSRSDLGSLNRMSWEEFERLVGEHFRRKGFHVTREGGNGPDGGVDLVLKRGGETHLVQCKQWKAFKVGVQPVREFYGVMAASGAVGGYFVTSGDFSGDAVRFVQGLNLELIDGRKLKAIIGPAAKNGSAPLPPQTQPRPILIAPTPPCPPPVPVPAGVPTCPNCGSEMKRRTARHGANAGKEFWGCSTYPKCKGTRLLEHHVAQDASVRLPAAPTAVVPEKKVCPHCGTELVLKTFQSGPKEGREFLGCIPCRKGWHLE